MKKRMIALAITAILALGMTACGGSTDQKETDQKVTESSNQETQPDETSQDTSVEETAEVANGDESIAEQVILDQDGIKITAKELIKDSFMGPEIELLIENNSDKKIIVQSRNVSINGYMVQPMMSTEVESGKSANDSLSFSSTELEENGIDTIGQIELNLVILDPDTYQSIFEPDAIIIETSAASEVSTTNDDNLTTLFEQDGIIISYKETDTEDWLGAGVRVFIENQTDQAIVVQARDMSVNGFMIDPIFSCDVMPGKMSNDSITIMQSQLDENNITNIENVELKFTILNSDTYESVLDTDAIVIE